MKEILFKKGYHLQVTSWENDADNFRTKTIHVGESVDNALELLRMCKELFASRHDTKPGIGNMNEDSYDKAVEVIQDYLRENEDVVTALTSYYGNEPIDIEDEIEVGEVVLSEFACDIMGSSEWYVCRVFESGKIIYAPEDIEVEVITTATRKTR